jgi:hypothetical protein
MHVDVTRIVHWSARGVSVAVGAFFFLTLVRESIALAERGSLGSLSTATYLSMSLVWIAAIGLAVAIRWPFFGGFLTVSTASASLVLLLLQGAPLHPAIALVAAAGTLNVLDGSLRGAARPHAAGARAG